MSKTCQSCKREVDNELVFCNFCGGFVGNEPVKDDNTKVVTPKNIITVSAVLLALSAIMLFVFVFDIFGLNKRDNSQLVGKGQKLFSMGLTPVSVSGKWGYADKNGKIVIAPMYDSAFPFAEDVNGLALVATIHSGGTFSGQTGVDLNNQTLEPLEMVRYGFIDEKGEYKISPSFTDAESFLKTGYAKINGINFINTAGEKMTGREYTFVSDFTDSGYAYAVFYTPADGFAEGETIPISTSKAYHYLNEYYIIGRDFEEKFVFSDSNDEGIADVFEDHFVYFRYAKGHEKEVISPRQFALASFDDGKPVTDFYDRIYKSNDFYIFCTYDEESYLYKAEIFDKELNKLNDAYYIDSSFRAYDSGLVLYKKTGTRYVRVLLNDDLKEVCEENAQVRILSGFDKSGIACVKEKDGYAGYNSEGRLFTSPFPFGKMNCGFAPFLSDDGRIGYINIKGEIVLKADYIAAAEFSADGYATVFKDGCYKIIDTTGKVIIDGLDYPINFIYGNNLDLKWYGNQSFGDNIRLMFDDGVISVGMRSLMDNDKYDVFSREYDYRLYRKDGTPISSEADIVSAYNSQSFGGALVARLEKDDERSWYEYKLIGNDGKIKNNGRKILSGAPDEYGIICSDTYVSETLNSYLYVIVKNKSYGYAKSCYYVDSDDGYYLNIGFGYVARVQDKQMRQIAVFPCNTEAEINGGKVLFYRNVQASFDWIVEESLSPYNCYYIYDYYNGRSIARLFDADGFIQKLKVTFTENGFIFCKDERPDKKDEVLSPDGKFLATGCDIVDDSYPGVVLLKNQEDGLYFFVDRFGNKSESYEYASAFGSDGYATVRKSDGKYYCIDSFFNDVMSLDQQFMGFCNGVAPFYDEETGYIGYINITGKTVIEPKFHAVSDFSYDGYAVAYDEYGRAFIIDRNGDTIIATDGFDGIEYVRHINDDEYGLYSRYSFENGYKYYLALSWEEEKDKLFRYGLTAVGKSDYNTAKAYLSDVYGNNVYGPYYKITSGIDTLPDGTPYFITSDAHGTEFQMIGLDGKPIELIDDFLGEITIMDNGNILVSSRNGYFVLDKHRNVISKGLLNANYRMGYLYCIEQDDETLTELILDNNMDPIEITNGDDGWYIRGYDLIYNNTYSSQISLNVSDYTFKSISSNEVILEKYGCDSSERVSIASNKKNTYICITGQNKGTLYSYTKEGGLNVMTDKLFEQLPDKQQITYYIDDIRNVHDRYIYGNIYHDKNTAWGLYGYFIYDIVNDTVTVTDCFQISGYSEYMGKIYWDIVGYGDFLSYILDEEQKRTLGSGESFLYSIVRDHCGYVIKENKNEDLIDGTIKDCYYYEDEDGNKILNRFHSCVPFYKDGYTTATVYFRIYDRNKLCIIDKSGAVVYTMD